MGVTMSTDKKYSLVTEEYYAKLMVYQDGSVENNLNSLEEKESW
jgi:hypothetical protein